MTMSYNQDHVRNDPRSVTAMLHGRGDGREKVYQRFASKVMKVAPSTTTKSIDVAYREALASGALYRAQVVKVILIVTSCFAYSAFVTRMLVQP